MARRSPPAADAAPHRNGALPQSEDDGHSGNHHRTLGDEETDFDADAADRSLGGNEHGAQIRQKPPSPQAGRAEHRPAPAHAAGAPHRLGTFSFI